MPEGEREGKCAKFTLPVLPASRKDRAFRRESRLQWSRYEARVRPKVVRSVALRPGIPARPAACGRGGARVRLPRSQNRRGNAKGRARGLCDVGRPKRRERRLRAAGASKIVELGAGTGSVSRYIRAMNPVLVERNGEWAALLRNV